MNSSAHSNVVVSSSTTEEVVVLNHCQGGIGIKIVGGKTSNGPSYGIFVKKTILGSPAARNDCLREGDKIVKVNKESLVCVNNERATSLLLNASRAGVVTFVIDRSELSYREYLDLIGTLTNKLSTPSKYTNFQYSGMEHFDSNEKVSPTSAQKRSWVLAGGRMSPLSPGPTPPSRTSPSNHGVSLRYKPEFQPVKENGVKSRYDDDGMERPVSLAESDGDSGLHLSSSTLNNLSHLMVTNITLTNGLGMSITGGVNHPDGPAVVVKEIINGGDVHCNGQIKQGDQIVSINGKSFLNVTNEEAKMKLTQMKLQADKEFEITFTNQRIDADAENSFEENRQLNEHTVQENKVPRKSPNQTENASKHGLSSQQYKTPNIDQNGNYSGSDEFSPTENLSSIMQSSLQPSSIPFYLRQDLASSNTLKDPKLQGKASGLKRRLSLAPASKLRVEKLEVALQYLGVHLTSQQQEEIRSRLHVDATGLVSYGEFVNVAQDVLGVELLDRSQSLSPGKLQYVVRNIEKNGLKLDFSTQPPKDGDAMEELKRQRDEAIAHSRHLQALLDEKKLSHIAEAEQLQCIKQTAEEALKESLVLKDQVFVATQAKMVTDRKDEEYEEVIKMLEEELRLLKKEGTPKQQEFQELQKKVVVLGSQLRKIEVVKRTYEVATNRLLSFVERVHDCLKRGPLSKLPSSSSSSNEKATIGPNQQPPLYLSERNASQTLADEARDLVRGVRILLEEEPLPFGWEEAYTCDGERYFINHVNQQTTWLHPISHVKKEKFEDV